MENIKSTMLPNLKFRQIILCGLFFLLHNFCHAQSTISSALAIDPLPASSGYYYTSDARSTAGMGNEYAANSSDDIYYKLNLKAPAYALVSHCGSGFDTYMALLDKDGNLICANDDNGPACSGMEASIGYFLEAGTYYIVSEGFNAASGSITTVFEFQFNSLPSPADWDLDHRIVTKSRFYNTAQITSWPETLEDAVPATVTASGITYQWESSLCADVDYKPISGATSATYSVASAPSVTTYYRRKTTHSYDFVYSNFVRIAAVPKNWENRNYIRLTDIVVSSITTRAAIDALPIGDKFQTTSYIDGLGQQLQTVNIETATPESGSLWGDMVQFNVYDILGRQPKEYLPYTTTAEPGKFKTTTISSQSSYYSTKYAETASYAQTTFDGSPLNRATTVKKPGDSWAANAGNTISYELNEAAENVQMFESDYTQGSQPLWKGGYPANSLYKKIFADENGKKVIEYITKEGSLILRKVQIENTPGATHSGWISTYNVYDQFGQLRCQIQPEGVKYLESNSWKFDAAGTILAEQCFLYDYDDKGRTIWKKTPGVKPIEMVYDKRDRLVFTQDDNQKNSSSKWTVQCYDPLDRPVLSFIYGASTSATRSSWETALSSSTTAPDTRSVSVTGISGSPSFDLSLSLCPFASSDINNTSSNTILGCQFYDNYDFPLVKSFGATAYNNTDAYSSGSNIMAISTTKRTLSMPTGSLVRVLGSTKFLASTQYYDERGAAIQALSDNIKGGTDIATNQYHFDGRLLSSCSNHSTGGSGGDNLTNFKILSKYNFDKIGRVVSVDKKIDGSSSFKTIASYQYDDMSRVKVKTLDPLYTTAKALEVLNYSYNIHGNLTGVNKDYALKTGVFDKSKHYFGYYLGYDNKDKALTRASLTGQVAGQVWCSRGDVVQRKYEYGYDNAGRLTEAQFTEKTATSQTWDNTKMDFTVSGISYDLNGNLAALKRKGVVPGQTTPIEIDNLSYVYNTSSNKLKAITDNATSAFSGKLGDYKDNINATDELLYDGNGNTTTEVNKGVKDLTGAGTAGIKYNHLDKPETIKIAGKGTISIVYSATGEKLQRRFTPEGSTTVKTTTYINEYIYYEETGGTTKALELQSIFFEEGRIRVFTPVAKATGSTDMLSISGNITLPNGKTGAYDYYLTDYLGNVRMILTEQTKTAKNTATMEADRAKDEELIFGQSGTGNELAKARYEKPGGWSGNTSAKVSRLGGSTAAINIGPNTLQKVMVGDVIAASTSYFHEGSAGGNNDILPAIITSLAAAISGSSLPGQVKDNAAAITNGLKGNTDFATAVQPGGSAPTSTSPQASLTILFFDEQFRLVSATDGGVVRQQVSSTATGSNGAKLEIAAAAAPKNGYAYIYISNQSKNYVYFDDFAVTIASSNVIEENHYYAFGLKIAALSSRRADVGNEGSLKNNYLYQGTYSELDEDIGWHDFPLRSYDAQLGRFMQADPFDQFPSPYTGMGNDPINLIDPSGGNVFDSWNIVTRTIFTSTVGAAVGGIVAEISGEDVGTGMLIGFGAGLVAGLSGDFLKGIQQLTNQIDQVFVAKSVGQGLDKQGGDGEANAFNSDKNVVYIIASGGGKGDEEMGDPLDQMIIRGDNNIERNKNRFHRINRRNKNGTVRQHHGIDLLAKKGTALKSINAGEVVHVVSTFKPGQYAENSFGNTVTIKMSTNGSALFIKYAHLDKVSVKKGDFVKKGGVIGETGNTGNAVKIPFSENHVHIETSFIAIPNRGIDRVDPELFFKTKFDNVGFPIRKQ